MSTGEAPRSTDRSSTRCTWARFTREGTWTAATRQLPELARLGITVDRDDADRRVRWDASAGATTASDLFAPITHLRDARRSSRVRRRARIAAASPSSSTSSTTTSARWEITFASSRRPTSPTATKTSGATAINFDGPDAGPGARVLHRERRVLDRRVSPRRPAARRDAADLRRIAGATSSPPLAGASAKRPAARDHPRGRERAAGHATGASGRSRAATALDALWNDDFHHSAMVALTGRAEAYYSDTRGDPQEFMSAAKYGYLFQGQRYDWQKQPRGTPALDLHRRAFVAFLQNHDQIANSARGTARTTRSTSPGKLARDDGAAAAAAGDADALPGTGVRRVVAVSLLRGLRSRHLATAVRKGRAEFLAQFPSLVESAKSEAARRSRRPGNVRALQARLVGERRRHADAYALHRDSAGAPPTVPRFAARRAAAWTARCCRRTRSSLRFFTAEPADDRLLVVNLGAELQCDVVCRSRCWRRRPAVSGRSSGPARIRLRRRRYAAPVSKRASGAFLPRVRASCHRPRRNGETVAVVERRQTGMTKRPAEPLRRIRGHRRRFAIPTRWSPASGSSPTASGGYASRHRARRHHAPVSRLAHRGAARAARPDRHAQPRRRAASLAGWTAGRDRRTRTGRRGRRRARHRLSRGVPARSGTARLALRRRRGRFSKSASFCRTGRTPCHVMYELLGGADRVELALRPSVNFRRAGSAGQRAARIAVRVPRHRRSLRDLSEDSAAAAAATRSARRRPDFTLKDKRTANVLYPVEESRGYQARGDLWSPGYFKLTLHKGRAGNAVASTEPFEIMTVLDSADALDSRARTASASDRPGRPGDARGVAAELVLAADQFIVTPAGRVEEAARARASGDEVRTVIAGYHWFTDWGRDTMISLEGLTLVTGRHRRGRLHPPDVCALRARRPHSQHVSRSAKSTGCITPPTPRCGSSMRSRATSTTPRTSYAARSLYATLKTIIEAHVAGTEFGIHVDPARRTAARRALRAISSPGWTRRSTTGS